jgi:CubicO group peptidase (beta-lactamase class C family)
MNTFICRLVILCLTLVLAACSENNSESIHSSEVNKELEQKPVLEKVLETPENKNLSLEQRLDDFMGNIHFSGSVLLVKDNKVKIAKGYNMANSENKQLNGPDTVFQIGSTTKAFTAAAILQLQEKGKLNINDPVEKYIKDYPYEKITLYELLTHTALWTMTAQSLQFGSI